jgi:hypothetical protein
MDPRWLHPFTCVISGPTGAGKTVFVKRFIEQAEEIMLPPPEEIVWCYGEWQVGYEAITGVTFLEGLPQKETYRDNKRRLIIIDDLMAETDERVTKLFTKGSHHCNISVIYIVQNLFGKNKEQRTISLNSHYLVVFKNPRDATQISHLAKQTYPGKVKYVQEAFKDATSVPYGYLVFDLRQSTPDHLRIRTNIFAENEQVVYVQK